MENIRDYCSSRPPMYLCALGSYMQANKHCDCFYKLIRFNKQKYSWNISLGTWLCLGPGNRIFAFDCVTFPKLLCFPTLLPRAHSVALAIWILHNIQIYNLLPLIGRWLALRLEFIGSCVILAAALLAVVSRNMDAETITAGIAGLSISYALGVSSLLSLNTMNYTVCFTANGYRERTLAILENGKFEPIYTKIYIICGYGC